MLLMSLMKRVAHKHGFRVLLHGESHSLVEWFEPNTTTGVSATDTGALFMDQANTRGQPPASWSLHR